MKTKRHRGTAWWVGTLLGILVISVPVAAGAQQEEPAETESHGGGDEPTAHSGSANGGHGCCAHHGSYERKDGQGTGHRGCCSKGSGSSAGHGGPSGMSGHSERDPGETTDHARRGRHGKGHGGSRRGVMRSAKTLIRNHARIERRVEEIPGGVKTTTTSSDPALVETLREHVRLVAALVESGGRVRHWDPLFAEIFDHYDQIRMEVRELEDGVEVVETSENPEVVKLIRAHAAKVDDFIARGHAAMKEATPLPEDYRRPESQ